MIFHDRTKMNWMAGDSWPVSAAKYDEG
jgi:hypothetical protein